MKHYVIGDIQGCYKGLRKLLKLAKFKPEKDKLVAVGDLVARGPDSLATLEYLYDLGEHFDTVLGNHDLHLLALAHGVGQQKPQDKLNTLLKSKHLPKYVDFLLQKPLALAPQKNVFISHAGLYPAWSIKKALKLSAEVQSQLQGENATKFLRNMYGSEPNKWDAKLRGTKRYRFIVNAFTRMRYLDENLALDFTTKCHPSMAQSNAIPWYLFKNKQLTKKQTLLFGHWASLVGELPKQLPNPATLHALDTGFVWGKSLTTYCLEKTKYYSISG